MTKDLFALLPATMSLNERARVIRAAADAMKRRNEPDGMTSNHTLHMGALEEQAVRAIADTLDTIARERGDLP